MIFTKAELDIQDNAGVRRHSAGAPVNTSDRKEYAAYEATQGRRSRNLGSELFDDIAFKASSIKMFTSLIPRLRLAGNERILEMGAGQAWASVLLKRAFPDAYVVASDMVPAALGFTANYEKMLDVFLDEKWAFNCRDIPFADNQFDRIFTVAAFHHFGERNDFYRALSEMVRILKPGGQIFLLYEPSSPKYLYKFMYRMANRRRQDDGVDEDVLVPSRMKAYEHSLKCKINLEYYTEYLHRDSIKSLLYYMMLSKIDFLRRFSVCTINVIIEKI